MFINNALMMISYILINIIFIISILQNILYLNDLTNCSSLFDFYWNCII